MDVKISRILLITHHFHMSGLKKKDKIETLSRSPQQFIELEYEKDVTVILHMLRDMGMKTNPNP